jgi:CO dehydrogenase/acetyl-CoA synthase epsilon subunit
MTITKTYEISLRLLRRFIGGLFYWELYRLEKENKRLIETNKAFSRSGKIVTIMPVVRVEGLEKLTRPLFLSGDNLLIKDNVINMVSKKEEANLSLICTANAVVQGCCFTRKIDKKAKINFTKEK